MDTLIKIFAAGLFLAAAYVFGLTDGYRAGKKDGVSAAVAEVERRAERSNIQ